MSTTKALSPQAVILRKFFAKKKAERAGYSLAVLARRVGLSGPFLSQLMSGQRPVPLEFIEPLCAALDLDRESRDELLKRVLEDRGLKGAPPAIAFNPRELGASAAGTAWSAAPAQQFNVLENWYTIAILDATLLEGYDGSAGFIAERLGLAVTTVEATLAMLRAAGLLTCEDGILRKATLLTEFNSSREQAALTKFNAELLDRAKQTLATETSAEDRERRLISGLVITGSAEKVAWAKLAILGIMREVAGEMSEASAEELYQLSVQFFPLTRRKKDE